MRICYQSYVDEAHGGPYWDYLRQHLDEVSQPDTQVDIWGITPHDSYAHPLVEMRCAREMICNAVRAETEGYDAFIVGHFQDSGLYEARSAVDIPVLALGEATMLYCCQLAQRSVIVTINPRFIPGFHLQLSRYGLRERVVDVAAMHFEPGQIMGAFGDPGKTDAVCRLCEFRRDRAPVHRHQAPAGLRVHRQPVHHHLDLVGHVLLELGDALQVVDRAVHADPHEPLAAGLGENGLGFPQFVDPADHREHESHIAPGAGSQDGAQFSFAPPGDTSRSRTEWRSPPAWRAAGNATGTRG